MKIKEIQNILKNAESINNIKNSETTVGSSRYVYFEGLKLFRDGLFNLEKTNLFDEQIIAIKNSIIYETSEDSVRVEFNEGRKLISRINNLLDVYKSLSKILDSISGQVKEFTISIKLPKVNDLEELANATEKFHKVFSQAIINDTIKGQVKIENIESGSIWVDIFVGSLTAVTLIGNLAWSAAVIYKKVQEGLLVKQHVTSLKIKNASLEEIQKAQKEAIDLMIDSEANHLYSESFTGEDNEQIERLKNSITMLSELLEKGAEVHPALNTPEKVANLFPNLKNLIGIESKIKKLTS
jgi:hypothetical protein